MRPYLKILAVLALTISSVCLAADVDTAAAEPTVVEVVDMSDITFPYVAAITGNDTNVRSGRGLNYYRCSKLNSSDKVIVVETKLGWSRIVPPVGSFSWVSKDYVLVDPENPTAGIITGENVNIWAGSDFLEPMHSSTRQCQLSGPDKVVLFGEEKENYYKIIPPENAYLWVSSQYLQYVGPVGDVEVASRLTAVVAAGAGAGEEGAGAVVTTTLSNEALKLKQYYGLAEKIDAEQKKPAEEQDYSAIKESLLEISGDESAGKAARYADFSIRKIAGIELAKKISEETMLQNEQLAKTLAKINAAAEAEKAAMPRLEKYAAIGQLKSSSIFNAEVPVYRIVDATDKTICYAVAVGAAAQDDLTAMLEKNVGLVGTIEAYPQASSALVTFTEIKVLD